MKQLQRGKDTGAIKTRLKSGVDSTQIKKLQLTIYFFYIAKGNNIESIRLVQSCSGFCQESIGANAHIATHPLPYFLPDPFFNFKTNINKTLFIKHLVVYPAKIQDCFIN